MHQQGHPSPPAFADSSAISGGWAERGLQQAVVNPGTACEPTEHSPICPEQRRIPVLFCRSVAPATVDSVDSQPVTGFTTGCYPSG
jgi:hypothetical protein